MSDDQRHSAGVAALAFGTLGIVFGDIGTSPLYSVREAFHHAELPINETMAYGVASIAFWALIIVICLKYLLLVMRADNHGEGGILALTSLVIPPEGQTVTKVAAAVVTLGVFGTSLLYGDGLITPAISVLSAVEGFEVATPAFADWIVPISVIILIGLFAVQQRGTAGIAKVFSPVMVVWFAVIGLLGAHQIAMHPQVMKAVNPKYAVDFFVAEPWKGFIALGSIFLVVTGGEALYADMGHFGRKPIQLAWYTLVLPGLILNYFGQAALLSQWHGEIGDRRPFYAMAPDWAITPLAILATMATVIASQALISGAFSLTVQAVQLDYLPRLAILHTSERHIGQVYVPLVNWLLMVGCVGLVIAFRTSSALAAAYGIAVTTTMLITTLIFFRFVRDKWRWSAWKAFLILIPFFIVDSVFLIANVPKIPHGGWFPLLVGFGLVIQMTTWRKGRQLVAARIRRGERPMQEVADEAIEAHITRVPGVAVYLFKDEGAAPPALMSNLRHNRILHDVVLLVSVHTEDLPRVIDETERAKTKDLGEGIMQVRLAYGFMEEPDIPLALSQLPGIEDKIDGATYFLGRESVSTGKAPGMHPWREELFVLLNRGAANASRFFKLPPDQVFEVGTRVEI